MKNEKRYRSEQFSITTVFLSVLGILILFLLTLVGAFDPAYNWIDEWFNNVVHQIYLVLFICGIISVWFWKWKFKEWRN